MDKHIFDMSSEEFSDLITRIKAGGCSRGELAAITNQASNMVEGHAGQDLDALQINMSKAVTQESFGEGVVRVFTDGTLLSLFRKLQRALAVLTAVFVSFDADEPQDEASADGSGETQSANAKPVEPGKSEDQKPADSEPGAAKKKA